MCISRKLFLIGWIHSLWGPCQHPLLSLFRWLKAELLWRRWQCTTDPSSLPFWLLHQCLSSPIPLCLSPRFLLVSLCLSSLQWSLGWWSFPGCCVWWCDQNVSSSFSSFVLLALASFLIVLKSRRWSCAAAMILAAVAGMSTFQMPLLSWWLSLNMPTIHTSMWQQRRRWLWLCVVFKGSCRLLGFSKLLSYFLLCFWSCIVFD